MKHSTLTMFRRVMALSLALLLVVGLTGCFGKGDGDPTEPPAAVDPTTAPTDAATEAPTEAATEAPTEPAVKGIMGTVSANNLNVRSNPSIADSTVLSQLPVNLRIEILEQKTEGGTNWGRIADMTLSNGTKISGGWINLHYVKLDTDETQSGATTETQPGSSSGTTPVDPDEEALGTITAEQLQIRKGAGNTYDPVGTYKKGDRVKILEQKTVSGTTWGRTEKGWISMTYVKLDGSAGTAVDTGTNIAQPGATTPTTGSGTGTGTGTSTGPALEVTNGKTTVKGYVVVDTDAMYLRTGPGTGYKSLGTTEEGDRYPYYQTNGDWYRTSAGWLSNAEEAYLYVEGEIADDAGIATVTVKEMYIRQGPGTNFKTVTTLKEGESVAILGQADGWGYTRKGWINMDDDYVSFSDGLNFTTGTAKVLVDGLNYREKADADSKSYGTLKSGKEVTIQSISTTDTNWGMISYNGKTAWINLTYVKMTNSAGVAQYLVDIPSASNGTVYANPNYGAAGSTITLTVVPDSGYRLKSLTVTKDGGEAVTVSSSNTFKMPACDVTVTAEFEAGSPTEYNMIVSATNGTVVSADRKTTFVEGADVTLEVIPANGYELDELTVTTAGGEEVPVSGDSFTMPAGNVTVNATFKALDYDVTIDSGAGGTVTASKTTANVGDKITLTIKPDTDSDPKYELDELKVVYAGTDTEIPVSSNKFTMPAADVEVIVTFKEKS